MMVLSPVSQAIASPSKTNGLDLGGCVMADPFSSVDYFLQFLETIDAGAHEVSPWEAAFLESLLTQRPAVLSTKQENLIRRMAAKYLREDI
jgi:hypothetical protein